MPTLTTKSNGNGDNQIVSRHDAEVEVEDSRSIREWLDSIGTQDIQVKVVRKEPRNYKGVRVDGTLETTNEFLDEEILKERYGGGSYQLIVMKRDSKGVLKHAGARTVRVGGCLPKFEDAAGELLGSVSPGGGSGAELAAIKLMQDENKRANERLERAEMRPAQPAIDPAIVHMFTSQLDAMRTANEALERRLADKDARVLDMITKKPEGSSFEQQILGKMLDGESTRLESLRIQHEAELRTVRETGRQDLERERDRNVDAIKSLEKRHEREIDVIRDSMKTAGESNKSAHEMRIEGLKAEIARLERELAGKVAEIGALRAIKEKSLPEQAKELVGLQETFKGLGIGGNDDDDDDKPWYMKLVSAAAENPEALGQLIGGVKQSVAPAAAQPAQRALPPRRKKRRPVPGAVVDAALGAPTMPKIDAGELAAAVSFMEQAVTANADPVAFAATARMAVPTNVIEFIEKMGVDEFLNSVAKLGQGSPLRTQLGRNWVRKVWSVLLEGAPA